MLRKHKRMWSGKLGEINETETRIDLVSDAKPFKPATYRDRPKTRDLEWAEIDMQLNAGIIKPVI